MFKVEVPSKEVRLKRELEIEKAKNAKLRADLEYVAMMADVEMEDDGNAQSEI